MPPGIPYHILARFYDSMEILLFSRKQKSPRRAVLDCLPEGPAHILDICAGTGTGAVLVAERRPDAAVVGIDRSLNMLALARRKIARKRLQNIEMLEMDALRLDFDDGAFDIVILSLVLHEMGRTRARRIMGEARRVLKPGGKVLVVEWEQPKRLLRRWLFLFIKLLEQDHFAHFLKMDFNKYFQDGGFAIAATRTCDYTRLFELRHLEAGETTERPEAKAGP